MGMIQWGGWFDITLCFHGVRWRVLIINAARFLFSRKTLWLRLLTLMTLAVWH